MSILWEKLIRPAMFRLDPERAHDLGMQALKTGLAHRFSGEAPDEGFLRQAFGPIKIFGLTFKNPIGLAAGFDKNGIAIQPLSMLGFGSIEVGTVTLEPQPGNPKPRIFRLPQQNALINRLGFNNDGAAVVAERLKNITKGNCVIGVNIGKNKDVSNEYAIENYESSFELLSPLADYVTVNVSSPNTPDLRDLQRSAILENLLRSLQAKNIYRKPLLVKIAPDLEDRDIEMIADISLKLGISGVIATNTTISRAGVPTDAAEQIGSGGLSGKPLEKMSTSVISSIYRYSNGELPIIGVGGIFTAADAYAKIAAGACLVQAYTGFVYRGPAFANEVNTGLARLLHEKGFNSLDEAVGSEAGA